MVGWGRRKRVKIMWEVRTKMKELGWMEAFCARHGAE